MINNNKSFHIKAFIVITIVYGVLATLDKYFLSNPSFGIFIFGYTMSLIILFRSCIKNKK